MVKRIKPVSRIEKIEAETNKIMGEFYFQKKEKELALEIQKAEE